MKHQILGLHHVTATVDEAQPDLDFYVGAIGLRLVKKTVNFDNHHVFHFYFGEPGGVLLEVATIQPGFRVDETLHDLGKGLKLPPWEERNRAEIEAGLPKVCVG